MAGKANVYNLGSKGNNVVKSLVQLEDGEFRKSQNLFVDVNGADGGVRKRNGLNKLNAAAAGAGGAVQGMINLPYPAAKTTTIYSGIMRKAGGPTTALWVETSNAGASWADNNTAPTRSAYQPNINTDHYANAIVSFRDKLYYAGDDYTLNTDDPTIHVWDGVVDDIIAYIPQNIAVGAPSQGISAMCIHRGELAIVTYDGGSVGTQNGRVFLLDPYSGELVQVGPAVAAGSYEFGGELPFAICSYQNKLWLAANHANFGSCQLYYIRPGIDAAWTLDETFPNNEILSMAVYKGKLYAGSGVGTSPATAPKVFVRSALGIWTTSYTGTNGSGLGASQMGALTVFGSNLFAFEYSSGRAAGDYIVVKKFNNTVWSDVYTLNDGGLLRVQERPGGAVVVGGAIYMVIAELDTLAETVNVTSDGIILKSTDGIAFTETKMRTNLSGRIGFVKV